MRLALISVVTGMAMAGPCTAQSDAPMQMGIPGDFVFVQPSAFVWAAHVGATVILSAHPQFAPIVRDYTANAPAQLIEIAFCGVDLPPFSPIAPSVNGALEIPVGSADVAQEIVRLMSGEATCDQMSFVSPPGALTLTSPDDERVVTSADIVSVEAVADPGTGQPVVLITFQPGVAEWFAKETEEHLGEVITISACGEVLTAPIVRTPILDGQIQISGSFTMDEVQALADVIAGRTPCAPG